MWRLLSIALLLSIVESVVVCPSKMSTGETYYCFSSSQVDTLQLVSANSVLASATMLPGNQHLYSLVIPDVTPGNYSVQEPNDATAKASVQLTGPAATLLLEADKALYKPGQVVRLRALALNAADLRPLARNLSFEVMSPEGFKLIKTMKATDEYGVAEFTFPIAQEPLLGRHLAQVAVPGAGAGASAQAPFSVEEYVLPRFQVSLTLDQSHLMVGSSTPATQRVTGKVFANFTFGEPVRGGKCSVVLWSPLMPWEATTSREDASSGTQHKALTSLTGLELDDTGSTTFTAEVSSDMMTSGGAIQVEATVVYGPTGERQSGTQQLPVQYQGSDLQVDMELGDGLEVFRPGLPVHVRLCLTKPDGQVPSQEELTGELVLVANLNAVSYGQRPDAIRVPLTASSFDSNGVQVVEIPMVKEDTSCCDPTASRRTWEEHQEACGCCVTYVTFNVERKLPGETYFQGLYSAPEGKSSSACAGRAYSPSGEFLAMDSPQQAEGRWSAKLRSTRKPPEPSVIQYMVTQAASMKAAGEATLSFSAAGNFWEATMEMDLPSSMSGDLQIIAMHSAANLPTLAASAKFSRPLMLPFNLSCSFSKQEVLPGEDLTVQLQATTGQAGRAFVASLDRSAELLGKRAAVSQSSILASLQSKSDAKAATPVAGKAWRHCVRGDDLMVIAQLEEDLQVVRVAADGGSDDAVYGEPLGDNCPRPLYDGTVCSSVGGGGIMVDDMVVMEMAMAGGPAPNQRDAVATAEESGQTAGADATGGTPVRTFFPETWIWTHVPLVPGQSAQAASGTLAVTAADTITSWSLEAFAVTSSGISATRAETSLRVFKPFFVEMRLPYAAVRGEELELIVAVFNYAGAGTLDAQLEVTLPAELELVDGTATTQLSVPENQATRAFLRVRPKALGSWQILCSASAAAFSDAMRKSLLVKAEGIPVSITETILVDLTGTANSFEATKTLTLPSNAVDGSAALSVTVVGDLLGPSIRGLDRLLQIPTGCGEQNMITLAPNVYVAKYLLATSKMTPDLRERVVNNMVVGYGRELTYRHDDGSFSAFGKSDDSGSTWLTAFVLRVFVEVQETALVAVDSGILKSATEFLISTQKADGSFRRVGQVIHQEMLGGASGSDLALSAYVTSALAKAQSSLSLSTLAPALAKAKTYLEAQSSSDTYVALLRAHALVLAGLWDKDQVATEVLSKSSTTGLYRYWSHSSNAGDGKALDIEMTGYGLLALTLADRLGEAFQAVRWLLERRTAAGGFSSTQDTVVALNALATYAISAGQSVDVALEVKDGQNFQESLQVTAQNTDVLQSLSPPVTSGAMPLTVTGSGSGMALVMANLEYNMPDWELPPCYTVEVQWFGTGDADAVQACGTPTANCGTPNSMAIISVGLFTGYAPSMSSLQALKDAKVVKRFEVNDGRVDFYLEELQGAASTCVQFKVTKEYQVWNVQPAASKVYEYYEPQSQGQTLAAFTMQEMSADLSNLVGLRDDDTTLEPTTAASAKERALAFAVIAIMLLVSL